MAHIFDHTRLWRALWFRNGSIISEIGDVH